MRARDVASSSGPKAPLAAGSTTIEFSPAASTVITAIPVGTSVQGYTLASRTLNGGGDHHWTVTVTKGLNTWTCEYIVAPPPNGRIVTIVDEAGRKWFIDPADVDGWLDGGL